MPHTAAFYNWKSRADTLFDALEPHHRDTLAEYSFGMALARCCGLTSVVAHLAAFLAVKPSTLRQRLRELYQPASAQIGSARSEFDFTLCFAPLIRWAAADHPDKRLVIALDPTCLTDRFRVPCAAVLYRGCGLPVARAVQTADEKGSWNDVWFDLLGTLKAALGDGWTVLVLTDRGPESADLFRAIVRLGWHPLMRVKAGGKFQPSTWRVGHSMNYFARKVGCKWSGEGVAYPSGQRLSCTLLASWGEGARRTLADPDGLAGEWSEPGLVRLADVDRARVSGDQTWLLAVAQDPDDRAFSCGEVVGSDRGGDSVHGGSRWRGRTGRIAEGPEEVEHSEARFVTDLAGDRVA